MLCSTASEYCYACLLNKCVLCSMCNCLNALQGEPKETRKEKIKKLIYRGKKFKVKVQENNWKKRKHKARTGKYIKNWVKRLINTRRVYVHLGRQWFSKDPGSCLWVQVTCIWGRSGREGRIWAGRSQRTWTLYRCTLDLLCHRYFFIILTTGVNIMQTTMVVLEGGWLCKNKK